MVGVMWDTTSWLVLMSQVSMCNEGRWSGNDDPTRDLWAGLNTKGAHANPNSGRVGEVLVGNFVENLPSAEEQELLTQLTARVAHETELTAAAIVGHQDVQATECPGTIETLLPDLEARVEFCQDHGY